jgi:hypothetical protein
MSTSLVYLKCLTPRRCRYMGEGVGVEVKECSTWSWSWKHSKKHHNVLVYISLCRWECNATPEVGCVMLKDWRSSWSTSSRLRFYLVTHELHALPNTTLNCTCVGRPHLPHLLTFWSTNFNITYGYWILCRERYLLSVVEISFLLEIYFLAVCFWLGTTSGWKPQCNLGKFRLVGSFYPLSKVPLTHISLIRRPSFTPVNALVAMFFFENVLPFCHMYIYIIFYFIFQNKNTIWDLLGSIN